VTTSDIALANPLPKGVCVGFYKVVSISPERLVLRGNRLMGALGIVLGLPAIAWGGWVWFKTLHGHGPLKLEIHHASPLVGLVMIAGGVVLLLSKYVFDGATRSMNNRSAGDGGYRVVVGVGSSRTDPHDMVSVAIHPGRKAPTILGKVRTDAEGAVYMLAAGATIAHLLHAPLEFSGECTQGSAAFVNFLGTLQAAVVPEPPAPALAA
jgi:hypothetical protein